MPPRTWRGRPVDYSYPYPRIYWPEHPLAIAGMVKIHRVVASEMLGRPLTPEDHVHHVNENKLDWRRSNLEVTNIKEHNAKHHPRQGQERNCSFCGKLLYVHPKDLAYCRSYCDQSCRNADFEKVSWPDTTALAALVREKTVREAARSLGVSDTAVRKRCRRLGIELPKRSSKKPL